MSRSNIVAKKLYITGGIGSTSNGEAFGKNYELPNMSAYCETCAAIGNVYVNYRLFLLHGESKYYDVLERSLYNGLISGVSLDGGQKQLVEGAGFISPFKSCTYIAADPFAQTISDYTAAGKTSAWHWLQNKDGLAQNALGQVYQDFASGSMDTDGFVQAVQQVLTQFYAS